jgi:hypothetical protein
LSLTAAKTKQNNNKNALRCFLSFHRKYTPHRIYRGTKFYLIGSPYPHLHKGPSSGHVSPLGYSDRVLFKLQAFSW